MTKTPTTIDAEVPDSERTPLTVKMTFERALRSYASIEEALQSDVGPRALAEGIMRYPSREVQVWDNMQEIERRAYRAAYQAGPRKHDSIEAYSRVMGLDPPCFTVEDVTCVAVEAPDLTNIPEPPSAPDIAAARAALGELGEVTEAVNSVARALAAERARLVHLSDHKHDPSATDPSVPRGCGPCTEWEQIKRAVFAIPGRDG